MSSTEHFNLVYDGPALSESRMDVRDLAPALVAVSDLFSAANAAVNGDGASVRVEVKGSFKAGSFGIDLVFNQDLLTQIRDIFAGPTSTAIANAGGILGLIGLAGGGLIALLRRLKGRQPSKIEIQGEIARVWITEIEQIEVDANVVRIWRSKEVRGSLDKVLSPLAREGITSLSVVRGKDEVVLDITDEELPWLATSPADVGEVVSDSVMHGTVLQIESVVFKDGNKWRVHDGQNGFHAAMDDADFLAKIEAGERFGKRDVLVVDLRRIQTILNGILHLEYRITKVLDHKQPLQQTLL
jgi:hypothetical protein